MVSKSASSDSSSTDVKLQDVLYVTALLGRMLTMREVAAIAVIKFFPMVISLLESLSLLVQEGKTSLMVRQILLMARVRRTRRIMGRRKLLIMALLMEFRVLLLFLLFLKSYNR